MYPVSSAWKTAAKAEDRTWAAKIYIETAYETFEIDESGIAEGSMKYNEGVTDGAAFGFGCAYKDDFSVTLNNTDGLFDDAQLNGAIVRPHVGLEVTPGNFEFVPLGVYVIDAVSGRNADYGQNSRIGIEAFNVMCRFEKPFSKVNIAFPCTALQLLTAICQHCGVPLGTADFLNKNYSIGVRPAEDMSCRNIISCVAEIAGCWARCDRYGRLELSWFRNPAPVIEANLDGNTDSADGGTFTGPPSKSYDGGLFKVDAPVNNLTPMNRKTFVVDDAPITVSGVLLEREDGNLLAGSDRNAITISDNPLIQDNAEEIAASLWAKVKTFAFLPYTSNWQGDPAVQAGDMITQTDRKGRTFRTIVTQSTFVLRKPATLYAGGKSDAAVGYVDPVARSASRVRGKLREKQEQINAQDMAARMMFALFTGIAGGYRIDGNELGGKHTGSTYLTLDSPDIEVAQDVWAYTPAGIFRFEHGIHNEPSSGWAGDGSALFSLVTASMIRTGLLQSNNGASWIDMDNGQFSLGNGALEFINGAFPVVRAARITNDAGNHYFYVGTGTYGYYGAAFAVDSSEYLEIWPSAAGWANLNFVNGGNIRCDGNLAMYFGGDGTDLYFGNYSAIFLRDGFLRIGFGTQNALTFDADGMTVTKGSIGYAGYNGVLGGIRFRNGVATGSA